MAKSLRLILSYLYIVHRIEADGKKQFELLEEHCVATSLLNEFLAIKY